ncbi:ferredoxin [Mycolicibacterium komossense]|uniref:Ferredoxin n=1 Tax=Mycolicibacterium komossense TaxID=1779 RepID=A0ABT3CJ38_9MYCO|nr:ferredoxin [Mycolicibacterium komossense]MCV7229509.1 ferredoxin [Mycolicibacterium komossense]
MTLRPDNRLDDAPMTTVQCQRCAAGVQVRKSSWSQTSVQWDAVASAGCVERKDAERLAPYGGGGLFLACSALSASIVRAARRGEVKIVDEQLSAT